jgi:spermidine synthase
MQRTWSLWTATVTGAVIMVVEFCGARMLENVWGSSMAVWGSTISVVLLGMAVGYHLGGRFADRRPRLSSLVWLLAASAVLLLGLAVFGRPLLSAIAEVFPDPRAGSLAGATATLALPALLMAAVSPVVLRLVLRAQRAGRDAGRVYVAGTVGSVLGTLAAAFWLVELLGLRGLIAGCAAVLVLWAGVGLLAAGRRAYGLVALLAVGPCLVAGAVALETAGRMSDLDGRGVVRERVQTGEVDITVVDSGSRRRMRFNDRLVQSEQLPADPDRLLLPYTQAAHYAACRPGRLNDVLVIGVGGGALIRSLHTFAPAARMDAVELHRDVLELSRRWFSLPDGDFVTFHVDDGRRFLAGSDRRYDLIVVDAFGADAVPAHLLSVEFFSLVRSHLTADGSMVLNLVAAPASELAEAVNATVGAAFGPVAVRVRAPEQAAGNLLLSTGTRPASERCIARIAGQLNLTPGQVSGWPVNVGRGAVLTDDRNPAAVLGRG